METRGRKKRRLQAMGRFGFWDIVIYALLVFGALLCLLPLLNMVAISFSDASAANAGLVVFWPIRTTTASYQEILKDSSFFQAFLVSVKRVFLGWLVSIVLMILMAYPLSKEKKEFRLRTPVTWIMIFTMLFSGGLIPTYLTVRALGLIDTIWALVLPGSVYAGNTVLMMRFFRNIPKEMDEAALVDGAGPLRTLVEIYLPVCLPGIATLSLFVIVGHWNEFFAGLIYMKDSAHYPLQTYIRSLTVQLDFMSMSPEEIEQRLKVSSQTFNAAKIVVSMVPILILYPFLQRYFVQGLTLGSVKG
jgi:putative aldouronate transport system permease protein